MCSHAPCAGIELHKQYTSLEFLQLAGTLLRGRWRPEILLACAEHTTVLSLWYVLQFR